MKVLFAGPSLSGELDRVSRCYPTLQIRPPAARGDIARAVIDGAEAIGLVDGFFGDSASVWHKEILFALDRGLAVAGGSSMGALRAAECHDFGMVGLGSIFQDYLDNTLLDDEAVALTHGPVELDWMPLSLPWVNFSATIDMMFEHSLVTADEHHSLIEAGQRLHFTDRTFQSALERCSSLSDQRRRELRVALQRHYVDRKRVDAWIVAEWLYCAEGSTRLPGWEWAPTIQWEALWQEIQRPTGGQKEDA